MSYEFCIFTTQPSSVCVTELNEDGKFKSNIKCRDEDRTVKFDIEKDDANVFAVTVLPKDQIYSGYNLELRFPSLLEGQNFPASLILDEKQQKEASKIEVGLKVIRNDGQTSETRVSRKLNDLFNNTYTCQCIEEGDENIFSLTTISFGTLKYG